VRVADLLRRFSERERQELYRALWATLPAEGCTRAIVVAAGRELLGFDPGALEHPAWRYELPDEAGPVRSVRYICDGAGSALLVGSAKGVHILSLGGVGSTDELPVKNVQTLTFSPPEGRPLVRGVNSVARCGQLVFATHSEVGLIVWDGETGGEPAVLFVGDGGRRGGGRTRGRLVRNALVVGDRLWLTVDAEAICCEVESVRRALQEGTEPEAVRYRGADGGVSALSVREQEVFAGTTGGELLRWERDRPDRPDRLRLARGAVESVCVVEGGPVMRLVYADGARAAHVLVPGDVYECEYEAGEHGVRRVAALADLLVGVNDRRDWLVCWRPGEPEQPMASVAVGRLCGHTIQDVCLWPMSAGQEIRLTDPLLLA